MNILKKKKEKSSLVRIPKDCLNLYGWESRSRAVGPGERFSIYTQGCPFKCPECFNPELHTLIEKNIIPIDDLVNLIISTKNIEGLTIGGGEPLIQEETVTKLCRQIRDKSGLSIILYTGYTIDEIENSPVLKYIDVLIDGRFDVSKKIQNDLRGSSNQMIHCITERYSQNNLVPEADITFHLAPTGEMHITGFPQKNFPF